MRCTRRMAGAYLAMPAALVLSAAGCIVIPHPRDVATARGQETKKPKLAGLRTGSSTRPDVERLLGMFNTDASGGPFFWARWQQVKFQIEWLAASYTGAASGSERAWKIVNAIAVFDQDDRLAAFRLCGESGLLDCLRLASREASMPLPLRSLILPADHQGAFHNGEGRIILWEGRLSFEEPKNQRHNCSVALREIAGVALHGRSSPEFLRLVIHFRPSACPAKLGVTASPRETWHLMGLLQAVGQSS